MGQKVTQPHELVHSEVCGPLNVQARGGSIYYISFIDKYSRYAFVYLMARNLRLLKSLWNVELKLKSN